MQLSSNSAVSQPAVEPYRPRLVVAPEPETTPPRRTWVWPVIFLVLLALGAAVATSRRSTVTAGSAAAAVPSATVSFGDLRQTLRITGSIAAENSVTLLAPRIQGSRSDLNRGGPGGGGGLDFNLVLLRLAEPGTMVKAGAVVGEFDTQNQLQRLDDYRDTVTQQQATIQKMTADLAASREARDQAARSAKAEWDKAVLDLKTAPVKSAIDAEKQRLTVEEDELSYREQLKQVAAFQESQSAALASAVFKLNQARSELQRAENNIAKMTIRAPIDGMVVLANVVLNNETRQVRAGDQIFAGQPFLSVVDPRSMVLTATINQVDAERLRLGMKAAVALDAFPEFAGTATVVGIGAMSVTSTFRASYVGALPVRLKIAEADTRLIPDLTGAADVILASESNTPIVPRSAVFPDGGKTFVYLRSAAGWERREVETGAANSIEVAVTAGLKQGETVALARPI